MWRVTWLCATPPRRLSALRRPVRMTVAPAAAVSLMSHQAAFYAPASLNERNARVTHTAGCTMDEANVGWGAWLDHGSSNDGDCVGGEVGPEEDVHRLDRVAQILAPSHDDTLFGGQGDAAVPLEWRADWHTMNDTQSATRWSESTVRQTLHKYSTGPPPKPHSAGDVDERAAKAELGGLLDHLTALSPEHPQKLSWGLYGCHLAQVWQLPEHGCRLFCSYASAMANAESWPQDRLHAARWSAALEATIAAAGLTRDATTLRLCLSIVQHMPPTAADAERQVGAISERGVAEESMIDMATGVTFKTTVPSAAGAERRGAASVAPHWRAGHREMLALSLYAQCIACLLHRPTTLPIAPQAHRTMADDASTMATTSPSVTPASMVVLQTTATMAARTVLLVMRPELWATCVAVSRRGMMYKTTLCEGVAAVWWGIFRQWCAVYDDDARPVRSWLSAPFLQALLRTCLRAGSEDTTTHVVLYVERYLDELACVRSGGGPSSPWRFCASDEALVATLLHYWQATRQGVRALRWLTRQRTRIPDWLPSPRVLLLVARIAGEARVVCWTTWSLDLLLNGARSSSAPTEAELYYCLLALARCGVPRFEQVLGSLRDGDLLRADDETLLFLRLQHCRHHPHGGDVLKALLQAHLPHVAPRTVTSAAPGPARQRAIFSARCIYQILAALQEREDVEFMTYYRFFLTHCTSTPILIELRGQWAALALAWLLAQVGHAVVGDVLYIANEVAALLVRLRPTTAVARVLVHRCALLRLHYDPAWWAAQPTTTAASPVLATTLTPAARSLFVTKGRPSPLPSLARSSMMRFVLHPRAVRTSGPSALSHFTRSTVVPPPRTMKERCASAVWLRGRLTWEHYLVLSSVP